MAKSIEQARRDVQGAMDGAMRWADRDEATTFHEFEVRLWSLLLALGRALIALFLARQVARRRATQYEHDGRKHVLTGEMRTTEIGTRCGKVSFKRPVGRRLGVSQRAKADLPVDRELGLCGGFSLGVVAAIARLCAQMSFASARSTFREFSEFAPSSRAALRMVDAVGGVARAFLEQAVVRDDDGEVLLILVDARGVPMIGSVEFSKRRLKRAAAAKNRRAERRRRRLANTRPRRTKGKKSKNAKCAFVGVIYSLRRTEDGFEGPINKRLYATFESHRALFVWLKAEAVKRGYGKKRSIFLADGSDHIWNLQQEFFPDAEPCVDWYHIVEKLWEAGACLHREGSDALQDWVHEQKRLLRRGKLKQLLENLSAAYSVLPKTGPGAKSKRDRLLEIMEHLAKNQHRMRYQKLRRDDLPIGSGAVEGAVRNLVGIRLDGPGMRWGLERAENILHLRCIHLNGQWEELVTYLSSRGLALAAQPKPARPHDAVTKAAA
jgi:hypothetical protein